MKKVLLFCLSICFIALGIYVFSLFWGDNILSFIKTYTLDSKTNAEYVFEDTRPSYEYYVDGIRYICVVQGSINADSEFNDNNRVVYYDSKNPKNCSTSYSRTKLFDFDFVTLIVILGTSPFFVVPLGIGISIMKKVFKKKTT